MFTKVLLLLLYSNPLIVFCQPITWIHGARTAGLANAGTALEDRWNASGNPAGIAGISSPALAISFERRFLLEELDSRAAIALLPIGKQVIGLNFNKFGKTLYQRQRISLSTARKLSPAFSVGFAINYNRLKIAGIPGQQAWSVSAGMQCRPVPRLTAGLFIVNPNQAAFDGKINEALPVSAALGVSWAFSEKVLGITELKRISGFPLSLRCGLEYLPHPALAIRTGISTAPFRQYGGLGLIWRQLHIDIAASSHLQLGWTPQISMSYGH